MRGAGADEELFPWTNYGFISYADHHYHFGMWLYAIAYYAKYNPVWASKEGEHKSTYFVNWKCRKPVLKACD